METQRGAFSRLGAVKQKTITAYTERKKTNKRNKEQKQNNKQTNNKVYFSG